MDDLHNVLSCLKSPFFFPPKVTGQQSSVIKRTLEDRDEAKVVVRGRVDVVRAPVGKVDPVTHTLLPHHPHRQNREKNNERPKRDRHFESASLTLPRLLVRKRKYDARKEKK